jgi:taurine dioxygenase
MSFKIVPPAAELGAEIRGIDLARPLSDATVDALKAAWGKRSVLLFRG